MWPSPGNSTRSNTTSSSTPASSKISRRLNSSSRSSRSKRIRSSSPTSRIWVCRMSSFLNYFRMLISSHLSSKLSYKRFSNKSGKKTWSLRRSNNITIFTPFWLKMLLRLSKDWPHSTVKTNLARIMTRRPSRESGIRSASTRTLWDNKSTSPKTRFAISNKSRSASRNNKRESRSWPSWEKRNLRKSCWTSRNLSCTREMPNRSDCAKKCISWPQISRRINCWRRSASSEKLSRRKSSRRQQWSTISRHSIRTRSPCWGRGLTLSALKGR